MPVYRLASNSAHLFTTSNTERLDAIARGNWTDEGVGFYCGTNPGHECDTEPYDKLAEIDAIIHS